MTLAAVSLTIAGLATLAFLHRCCLSQSGTITRARFDRAVSGMKVASASPENLPSIVRSRYASLRGREKIPLAVFRPILYLTQSFELLDIRCSLRTGAITFFVSSFLFGWLIHLYTNARFLSASALAAVAIIFLIYTCLGIAKKRLMAEFQRLLPDALDLVVRSVRAGLPVSEAIKMISAEVPNPVGAAFSEVGSNVSIGISLNDALNQLATKIPIAELRFFAISLAVQQETGGNLAEILSNLSKLMRKRVQVRKKIRALSSEARASALIIGSLPFIVGAVIFWLNRSYIEVLLFDDDGRFLMLCALTSIATGGMIMAKLIRFKI